VLPVQPNQKSHILFDGTNSKTPKEEKREELFETLKVNDSIRWVVDIIDQRNTPLKCLRSKLILILDKIISIVLCLILKKIGLDKLEW
jgi:ribonuclease HII